MMVISGDDGMLSGENGRKAMKWNQKITAKNIHKIKKENEQE